MLATENDLHDAGLIVERVLGVSVKPVAPWDPVRGRDLDLSEAGRHVGAMVVARSVSSPRSQFLGARRRLVWVAVGQRSWVIRLVAETRSLPDGHMIVGLLAELEAAGGTMFRRADQVRVAALRAAGVRLSPAERVLEDLAAFGVVGAESGLGIDDPPTVVARNPSSGNTSAAAINDVVEEESWRPANRARLAGSGDADRHLFVWIDLACVVAHEAMGPDEAPAPPLFAPEATVLWVARRPTAGSGLLADRLWQTNDAREWETLGSISDPAVPVALVDVQV